jgi:DNA-binding transcriptional MerR regulator
VANLMRIGELAARTGLSIDRIRVWERRYRLVQPVRSAGGFRLYSEEDLQTLLAMRDLVESGVPASEAARRVRSEQASGGGASPDQRLIPQVANRLRLALDAWNEHEAQAALDDAFAAFDFETLVDELLVPYLNELGDRWARGEISVAHEHFASSVIRGRLMAFARGWDRGFGPRLVLACVPGELHDLPLVMFGILARRRGWRITFLGADTPIATVDVARRAVAPAGVILASSTEEGFEANATGVAELAAGGPVALGGRGATERIGEAFGLPVLPRSLTEAAAALEDVFASLLERPRP